MLTAIYEELQDSGNSRVALCVESLNYVACSEEIDLSCRKAHPFGRANMPIPKARQSRLET